MANHRPDFQAKFDGIVEKLDIAGDAEGSLTHINDFVANVTHNQIQNVLAPRDLGMVVLLNAAYFHGNWAKAFDANDTISTEFRGFNGIKMVDMMKQAGRFNYGEFRHFAVDQQIILCEAYEI